MTLPDLWEGSRSKAARAHRRRHANAIIATIMKAGAKVVCLSKDNGHYRLTLTSGLQVDFWTTTLRWEAKGGGHPRGATLTSLLAVVASPPPPAPAKSKAVEGLVSVFADGSFDHRTGRAGWGVIMSDGCGQWIEAGGELTGCTNSMEAEMRAIANGIHVGVVRDLIPRGALLMIQSDCTGALSIILGAVPGAKFSPGPSDVVISPARRLHKSMRESEGLASIREMVESRRLRILVRHNRGHTSADKRGKISERVDRLSREYRRSVDA